MIYYILVIFNVFMAAVAQMLLKKGASIPKKSVVREYIDLWVIGGYALMGLTLLLNVFAMSRGVKMKEISIIESLSYLFVPLLGWWLFGERITAKKAVSIIIIIAGIILFFN